MDMASNQPDNLALTAEQLREYSAAFNADRANLVAANAAVSNGILQAATSYRGVRELPRTFSVELKQGSITSQEHSGRCWMFASLKLYHRLPLSAVIARRTGLYRLEGTVEGT